MGALTVLSPRRSVSNPSIPSVEAFQIPMLGGKARARVVTGLAHAARRKFWDLRFRHPFLNMNVPSVPKQPQGPRSTVTFTAQGILPPYHATHATFHTIPESVRTAILKKEVPACAYQKRTWHAGLVSGLIATGCSPAPRSNLSLLSLTSRMSRRGARRRARSSGGFSVLLASHHARKHGLVNAVFNAASSVQWWDGL
jgi:hypothetical protein